LRPRNCGPSSKGFVRYRREYLTGDEKGEAQVYCERLFRAFGHKGLHEAGATLETRLKKNDAKGTSSADLGWRRVGQAQRGLPVQARSAVASAAPLPALQLWAGTVGFLADNRRVCRVQCNRTRRR
jgi:hypothetical protein